MSYNYKEQKHKNWWAAVWRGLVVDSQAKHYKAMRSALWLFLYLVIHADRKTGHLSRRYVTISSDMGVKIRTVRNWVSILRKAGYLKVERSRGSLAIQIEIQKWKPFIKSSR